MLVMAEYKEERVKTLLARLKRLDRYQSSFVTGPEWAKSGIPKNWMRAQKLRAPIERELGGLASICLREVA